MENKVQIQNITNHVVGLIVPDLRLNRDIQPGKTIQVKADVLEDAMSYPGVEKLFRNKYLKFVNAEEAVDYGVIDEEDVEQTSEGAVQKNAQDAAEILDIIDNGTAFQLKKLLESESESRKREIADIAATSEKIGMDKIDIIKKMTGIDLTLIKDRG